jgi:hypothetical protein
MSGTRKYRRWQKTHFDGISYRSRLEARWAERIKTAGETHDILAWYEPFQLRCGEHVYTPDFLLATIIDDAPRWAFVEIKPTPPTDGELEKFNVLALHCGLPTFFVVGPPDRSDIAGFRLQESASAVPLFDLLGAPVRVEALADYALKDLERILGFCPCCNASEITRLFLTGRYASKGVTRSARSTA